MLARFTLRDFTFYGSVVNGFVCQVPVSTRLLLLCRDTFACCRLICFPAASLHSLPFPIVLSCSCSLFGIVYIDNLFSKNRDSFTVYFQRVGLLFLFLALLLSAGLSKGGEFFWEERCFYLFITYWSVTLQSLGSFCPDLYIAYFLEICFLI